MRKFLIATTGRSGSTRMARILNNLGIHCGHESVFSIGWAHSIVRFGEMQPFPQAKWDGADGDCGWPSFPGIDILPKDAILFHMVRNPLDVAWSYYTGWRTTTTETRDRQVEFLEYFGLAPPEMSHLERTDRRYWHRYWLIHSLGVEAKAKQFGLDYRRFRIEGLQVGEPGDGVDLMRRILKILGREDETKMSDVAIKAALARAPENCNGTAAHHPEESWEGVDPAVKWLARRYGYEVD